MIAGSWAYSGQKFKMRRIRASFFSLWRSTSVSPYPLSLFTFWSSRRFFSFFWFAPKMENSKLVEAVGTSEGMWGESISSKNEVHFILLKKNKIILFWKFEIEELHTILVEEKCGNHFDAISHRWWSVRVHIDRRKVPWFQIRVPVNILKRPFFIQGKLFCCIVSLTLQTPVWFCCTIYRRLESPVFHRVQCEHFSGLRTHPTIVSDLSLMLRLKASSFGRTSACVATKIKNTIFEWKFIICIHFSDNFQHRNPQVSRDLCPPSLPPQVYQLACDRLSSKNKCFVVFKKINK